MQQVRRKHSVYLYVGSKSGVQFIHYSSHDLIHKLTLTLIFIVFLSPSLKLFSSDIFVLHEGKLPDMSETRYTTVITAITVEYCMYRQPKHKA